MSLKLIVKSEMCRKLNCPALYQDKDGTFYVQGYSVTNVQEKLANLPDGETIVRVDASLVKLIKESNVVC